MPLKGATVPRDIREIQDELDAARAKADRIADDMKTLNDRAEKNGDGVDSGWMQRSSRLMAGLEKAEGDIDRLSEELAKAIRGARRSERLDLIRSKTEDRRNLLSGDGSVEYIGRTRRDTYHDDIMRSNALRHIDHLAKSDELGRELLTARVGDALDKLVRREDEHFDGGYVARRLLLTENPMYRSAFQKYVRSGSTGRPLLLTADESNAVAEFEQFELRRAASENTTTAGGFGVPVLIDSSIILTSGAADAPILRVCRVEQITTNIWKGVSSAGASWSYDTEAAEVSDDAPTLAQPSVTVHMARGFVPYSFEVAQDFPDFAAEMTKVLNQGYLDLIAAKSMTGTGTGEPWGIFTAIDQTAGSEVVTTTDGSFGGVDIFKTWNSLGERFRPRSTWVMSVHVASAIRQFSATAGSSSAYFTVDLQGETFRINERPVIVTDYAPTFASGVPGTTGAANILIVGDFQNYLMAARAGMSVEVVPHLLGSNRRPSGQRGMLAWARHGLDSIADESFRLLQNA